MKREIVWLMSCLMMITLLLVSCAPAVTKEEAAPPEEEEVTEEEAVTFEQPFSIGGTAQTSKRAVTILEAIITDSYEYYDTIAEETRTKKASPGMSFLIATVEIKNVGGTRIDNVGTMAMYAFDSEVSRYSPGTYRGEEPLKGITVVSPGEKTRGKVLFEIRKGASGLKIVYNMASYPNINRAEWEIK